MYKFCDRRNFALIFIALSKPTCGPYIQSDSSRLYVYTPNHINTHVDTHARIYTNTNEETKTRALIRLTTRRVWIDDNNLLVCGMRHTHTHIIYIYIYIWWRVLCPRAGPRCFQSLLTCSTLCSAWRQVGPQCFSVIRDLTAPKTSEWSERKWFPVAFLCRQWTLTACPGPHMQVIDPHAAQAHLVVPRWVANPRPRGLRAGVLPLRPQLHVRPLASR